MDFIKENWKMIAIVAAVAIVGFFIYYNYFCPQAQMEHMHGGDKGGDKQSAEAGEFVMFHMPWCSHCKKVMPVWNKLNIKDISIRTVNCDEHPDVSEAHNIASFPTFRYYPNGMEDTDNYVPYEGDRTLEDFMKFLNAVRAQ